MRGKREEKRVVRLHFSRCQGTEVYFPRTTEMPWKRHRTLVKSASCWNKTNTQRGRGCPAGGRGPAERAPPQANPQTPVQVEPCRGALGIRNLRAAPPPRAALGLETQREGAFSRITGVAFFWKHNIHFSFHSEEPEAKWRRRSEGAKTNNEKKCIHHPSLLHGLRTKGPVRRPKQWLQSSQPFFDPS